MSTDTGIAFHTTGWNPVLVKRCRAGAWLLLAVLSLGGFSTRVAALTVTRGPYLQIGTPNSIVVRWRTDTSTDSVVSYGNSASALGNSVSVGAGTTEHVVTLTGLQPATRYYYAIGNSGGLLAGSGDASYSFKTAPNPGTVMPVRIWAVGDSGSTTASTQAVRDQYMAYTGDKNTNVFLMLGDNAYDNGTDSEYQAAVFDMFPVMLRQVAVWPTLGNHDVFHENDTPQDPANIPYYDMFSLPAGGEAGGVPSGTEEYYSFDYGNVHFICMNSFNVPRSPGSPMLTWLQNDIGATNRQWIIAYWHHPPYTKGSHDSDIETWSIDMRQNVLPILESYGVDLVLTGHSHSYERSYLLNGHYGLSTTLTSNMILDAGNGREDGDGVYTKPNVTGVPNEGAVYVVAGSSSYTQTPYWETGRGMHPAMYIGVVERGSMVLDVNGSRLDAIFLNRYGVIQDHFTLSKGADTIPPEVLSAAATSSNLVTVDFSEKLDVTSAETASNYTLGNGTTVNSATLDGNGHSVILNVTPLTPYVTYTLTVTGVKDLAGNPVASGSQAQFVHDPVVTLELQDGVAPTAGYAGTRDTYIREQFADSNYGSATTLSVDGQQKDYSALLRWDLSGVPVGATIQSASLTLDLSDTSTDSYELYELLRDWQESTATWNAAAAGSPWESPGASGTSDRDGLALASIVGNATGAMTFPLNADGIAVIQSWVDGTNSNYGFVLADTTPSDRLDFSSREAATALTRPRLTITYTTAPVDTDGDGLSDSVEATLGTNPGMNDTDGDGVSDYDEVNRDGNSGSYAAGVDTDPLNPDTDGDRLNDGVEIAHGSNPLDPGSYPSLADGDLAPLGLPDGSINVADYLISLRITLGLVAPTVLELAHGDLYPPGSPDGVINLSDTLLQQQRLFTAP